MGNNAKSDWIQWISLLFGEQGGAGQHIRQSWTDWFKQHSSSEQRGTTVRQWLTTLDVTTKHATDFFDYLKSVHGTDQPRASVTELAELKARIERLEAHLLEQETPSSAPK